jgi:signal transduction histidine kinase
MRQLTLIFCLLLSLLTVKIFGQALTDSTYVAKLKEVNDRVHLSSESNDLAALAKAYYDRATYNFIVPLRNQDIIGDLIQSAKTYKYLQDDLGYYNARMALAEFYILEEIFLDEALKLTAEAFRFYNEYGIKRRIINCTIQLGRIYQKKQDYEKAISYVEQALQASIEIEDHISELESRILVVELFGKLGNVESAVEQGLYTIDLERQYGLSIAGPKIYHLMAQNLYLDGQIDQALIYATKCQDLNKKEDLLAQNNYELLSKIYFEKEEPNLAYESSERSGAIKTELYNQEKFALSNQLAVKYQTYEKERAIRELVLDNELKELRLAQRTRLFIILFSLLFFFSAVAIYLYRLQKQKLATKNLIAQQQEEISNQKITDLENSLKIKNLKAMVKGQEAERTRIATDLHDSLGGMLSTLKLQYDSLQLDHKDLSENQDYYKIMDLIDEACKDVRDIARNLKPNALERLGLAAALKDLINRYSSRGVLDISLHMNEVDGLLDEDSKLHVYRIIQELLNNSLKHAQATEIDVQANKNGHDLVIVVEDNGIGFDKTTVRKGLGFDNLLSRVNLLKGGIEIDSTINKGTSVIVHIPLASTISIAAD